MAGFGEPTSGTGTRSNPPACAAGCGLVTWYPAVPAIKQSRPGPSPGHVAPVLPVYSLHQPQLLPRLHTQESEKRERTRPQASGETQSRGKAQQHSEPLRPWEGTWYPQPSPGVHGTVMQVSHGHAELAVSPTRPSTVPSTHPGGPSLEPQ